MNNANGKIENTKSPHPLTGFRLLLLCLCFIAGFSAHTLIPTFYSASNRSKQVSDVDSPLGIVKPTSEELVGGKELLNTLKAGGHILFFRHFDTTKIGVNLDTRSPEHPNLTLKDFSDCDWQKPVTSLGLLRAKHVGNAIRKLGVPVGKVYSSPYCRCVESVRMFNLDQKHEFMEGLVFRSKHYAREESERFTHSMLQVVPAAEKNTIIMGHRPAMDIAGEIEEGEAFVFRPSKDKGYTLIGKIKSHEWFEAAEISTFYLGQLELSISNPPNADLRAAIHVEDTVESILSSFEAKADANEVDTESLALESS